MPPASINFLEVLHVLLMSSPKNQFTKIEKTISNTRYGSPHA